MKVASWPHILLTCPETRKVHCGKTIGFFSVLGDHGLHVRHPDEPQCLVTAGSQFLAGLSLGKSIFIFLVLPPREKLNLFQNYKDNLARLSQTSSPLLHRVFKQYLSLCYGSEPLITLGRGERSSCLACWVPCIFCLSQGFSFERLRGMWDIPMVPRSWLKAVGFCLGSLLSLLVIAAQSLRLIFLWVLSLNKDLGRGGDRQGDGALWF